MERNELFSLFCKIGASSEPDIQRVSDMFNAVFYSFGGGDTSTPSSRTVVVHPSIIALRTEFKRHVRRNPWAYLSPPKLATAVQEAETECRKVIDPVSNYAAKSVDDSKKLEEEMKEESGWFEKVNEWKREMVLKENFDGAVKSFKSRLSAECRLDEVTPPPDAADSKQPDMRAVGNKLMRAVITECASEFPSFEEEAEVSRWLNELYQECSQVLTETCRKSAEHTIIPLVVSRYKAEMETFLREHLFAKRDAVELFRLQLQVKYEHQDRALTLSQVLGEPTMKSVWDERIKKENANLESDWKAKQDGAIAEFRKGLKAQAQRIAEVEHNVQLDDDAKLEALLAKDFPSVLRTLMEDAEESKRLGDCFSFSGGESAEDAKRVEEKTGEDQIERPGGGDGEPLKRIDVDKLEGLEEKPGGGGVSIKVEPQEAADYNVETIISGDKGNGTGVVPVVTSSGNIINNDKRKKCAKRNSTTLLASIWILFREQSQHHHHHIHRRHYPIFPKGTTFPTATPSTTELSVYLGKKCSSTAFILFYEKDSERSERLGKLEVGGGGTHVDKSGVATFRLTCHIDSSGVFHAEATGSKSLEKKSFTFQAKTSTRWSERRRGRDDDEPSSGRVHDAGSKKRRRRRSSGSSSHSTRPSSSTHHKRTK